MGKRDKLFVAFQGETAGQFVRFAVVGTINTVADFSVYVLLTRSSVFWGSHLVSAAVVSFSVGVVSSFILNNFWTFRLSGTNWRARIGKFSAVAMGGMLLNAAILHMFIRTGMYDLLAKAIATVLVMGWNFALQKMWTFRTVPADD